LEQREAAPACKQVKRNSLKGILDEFGIERNKFYYELNKRVGQKLQEVYDGSRKMTSSICFEDCGVLNEDAMNAIMSYNNSKKREREEKDE
jgi:hypothetical protein